MASTSKQLNQLYEFGEFKLNVAERLLRRGEKPVALTPKAFETLLALVRDAAQRCLKHLEPAGRWKPTKTVNQIQIWSHLSVCLVTR
jgi:DNA-binding response OmpR family regulator